MKMRIATLLLHNSVSCGDRLRWHNHFSEGPIDGNDNGISITGPNNQMPRGAFQDIWNGFVAANSGVPNSLEFGEWISAGQGRRVLAMK